MGFMKKDADEREMAYTILKNIGAINACPIHEDWYYTVGKDHNLVYGLASNKYKELMESNTVPQSFRDKLKVILNEGSISDECPYCNKL